MGLLLASWSFRLAGEPMVGVIRGGDFWGWGRSQRVRGATWSGQCSRKVLRRSLPSWGWAMGARTLVTLTWTYETAEDGHEACRYQGE